ncbi:MAG: hypothetical protein N2Z74_00795 [Syntrophales bacterium]|nr:hypothetical protein [Syntrophales bacterium]
MKKLTLPILLGGVLLNISCAPMPTKGTVVLKLKNEYSFPFVIFDFMSATMHLVALNGKEVYRTGWAVLPPGRHELVVLVAKGPTGYLGTAPLRGTCRASLDILTEANQGYTLQYKSNDEDREIIQVIHNETRAILSEAPCIPCGGRAR